MTSRSLRQIIPPFVIALTWLAATVVADETETPPDADRASVFELPCEYPLISEGDVTPYRIIEPSSYRPHSRRAALSFPEQFDLRNVDGRNYVTPVKLQLGGTCWTHGTMASLESHILLSGRPWIAFRPEQTYPCMDEYHLDWWNGFNEHFNADIHPTSGEGLDPHYGGDYLVASAYFARNDGALDRFQTSGTLYRGTFDTPAAYRTGWYVRYYPREVEWLNCGAENEYIDVVKEALQTKGAVGTAITWANSFFSDSGCTFYQPPTSVALPNHAVTIVGWDDTKVTQAPLPGAWLTKNSWGSNWGQAGYFWISYYDKTAGHHPEMGAVVFHDFEITGPRTVYYHDYHGWRDTRTNCPRAVNAFTAVDDKLISDVSFFTTVDNVTWTVGVYDDFDPISGPANLLAWATGFAEHIGLHTVALDRRLKLERHGDFFVALVLSDGGQAFDRTSIVPVLLGAEESGALVRSAAAPGQSYYSEESAWQDLYSIDTTANFCIKALAEPIVPFGVSSVIGPPPLAVTFTPAWPESEVLGCHWRFDDGTESFEMTPTHAFDRLGTHDLEVTLETTSGTQECLYREAFAVHSDSVVIAAVSGEGTAFRVDVRLHNRLRIDMATLPLTWNGPLELRLDSASSAGCRTEGLGDLFLVGRSQEARTATLIWQCDAPNYLTPGNGSLVSLWFTCAGGPSGAANPVRVAACDEFQPGLSCVGLIGYLPYFVDGEIVVSCCVDRVGDANGEGGDEPTIGDVSIMIDALFISGDGDIIPCIAEADVNRSGGDTPRLEDISIGDISMLIDYLFITGSSLGLPDCR